MTTEQLMQRLICEFPNWTNEQAWLAAERITVCAEAMQFQMEVERDLAALPLTVEEDKWPTTS